MNITELFLQFASMIVFLFLMGIVVISVVQIVLSVTQRNIDDTIRRYHD
jgi:hypothetical protein